MQSAGHSIMRNTRTMMIAQVITWASSFVLMMFLPRYLGAENYGRLYFVLSLTLLGSMLIDLGLNNFFVKEVARDKSKAGIFLVNASGIKIIAWAAALAGILIYLDQANYSSEMSEVFIVLGIGMLFQTLSDQLHRVFQSFEQMQYRSAAVIIERVVLAAAGVSLLITGYGIVAIAEVMTFCMMLNFITSAYFLTRLMTLKFRIRLKTWIELLRGALPFMISTVFAFVYFRIDVVMLSAMTNDRIVGWYGAPYKLFDTLMFFPVILQTAVYPVFSHLWKESKEELFYVTKRLMSITIIAGTAASFLLISQSRHIIDMLFGLKDFAGSVIILQGLSLCIPLVYANFIITIVDLVSDKQKALSVISIAASFINIGLNYLIIPQFQNTNGNGAIGAMISTIITEICVMIMIIYLLPSRAFLKENILTAVLSIAAGIISASVIGLFEAFIHLWVVNSVIGIMIYTVLLVLMGVLTRNDLDILLLFLLRRKSVVS
jgi:O-antigen/teichoic acid export membrane protein